MGKSDSTEIEKRVNVIYLMLIQGFQRKTIIQYCAKNFEIGERQADEYIKKARDTMSAEMDIATDLKKSEILSQLYDLYTKNYKIEDYRECRNILSQISDILGVKAPEKVESNSIIKLISLGNGRDPNETPT